MDFSVPPLVLMYHGVPWRGSAHVFDVRAFEEHMLFLKRNCTFIPPEEHATARASLRKPMVLLTFDDGFRNNAEVVAPVLRRHGIPAVFFISSRHCVPGKYLWFTYLKTLRAYFQDDGVWLNGAFILLRGAQRDAGIQELRYRLISLKPYPTAMYEAIDTQLPKLEEFVSSGVLAQECQGMSIEQIRELGSDPLFTVGGHTVDHPHLTRCEPQEAERQIAENRIWLQRVTGKSCDLFAYPAGDLDSNVVQLCRRLGFQKGYGVESNLVRDRQFASRRIGVYSRSLAFLGIKVWCGHWLPTRTIQRVRTSVKACGIGLQRALGRGEQRTVSGIQRRTTLKNLDK